MSLLLRYAIRLIIILWIIFLVLCWKINNSYFSLQQYILNDNYQQKSENLNNNKMMKIDRKAHV